jgi:hypothetical protein
VRGIVRRVKPESRHLSIFIDRPMPEVYAFAADPANLPRWAPGLGGSVVHEDGEWYVETPGGRARLRFTPPNELGILDHEVLTPSGETVFMPLRVIPDGAGRCEVVFSVRRQPGMSDAEYERDLSAVNGDLVLLQQLFDGP